MHGVISEGPTFEGQPEALQISSKVLETLSSVIVLIGVKLQRYGLGVGGDVLGASHDGPTVTMLLSLLSQHQPVSPTTTLSRLQQKVIEANDDPRLDFRFQTTQAVDVGRVVVGVVWRHDVARLHPSFYSATNVDYWGLCVRQGDVVLATLDNQYTHIRVFVLLCSSLLEW